MKYILILLFPAFLVGQNDDAILKDFNNDGYTDTLSSYYTGGSGFGGTYVTLVNGKTGENFELNNFGCFCNIKETILIPPKLKKESNKPFLDAIKNELLPEHRKSPDASLQWLITANLNHYEIPDNNYFDLFINSPTKWITGEIELPNTYYIDIKGETLHKLYFTESEKPSWYDSITNEGWLVYYGHNHFRNENGDSLVFADSSDAYQAFSTSHGVVLEKDNSYAWVFVTDFRLTGSPQKLRWESIGNVKIVENYVVIQLINSEYFLNPIFIIDIEGGFSGRLKTGDFCNKSYKIEEGKIIIENNTSSRSFLLENLFQELKCNR
ncbi:MAG: hypothetical protein K8R68_10020 [Bacteroidales bacterium]|nr:hypothetical protein [Bacteroidales bacterium]